MEFITDKEFKEALGKIEKYVNDFKEELSKLFRNSMASLRDEFNDLRSWKDPNNTTGRINILGDTLGQLSNQVNTMNNRLNNYQAAKKFIEEFKDEELSQLYVDSGMTLQEIRDALTKIDKSFEDRDIQSIYKYVRGEVKDPYIREKVGIFLRGKVLARK